MNEPSFDIFELSNNAKGLIYKIQIAECWKFLCAFSEKEFWIRELNKDKEQTKTNDELLFRMDLDPISNIESYIRRLSVSDDRKLIKIKPSILMFGSDNLKLKYAYLIEYFINDDNSEFCKNDLMLLILDKIIDSSFDDSILSANCRILLDKFTKCMLGKYLLLRMIFYKYVTYFYNTRIGIWQKSPIVKSWFLEFYEVLIKNDLEKYYPPENISGDLTRWFIPPEKDLIQFLDFAKKARFRFND
jgi:hypothetical protein